MNKKIEKVSSELKKNDGLMQYRKNAIIDVIIIYTIMSALGIPIVNGFLYGISPVLALVGCLFTIVLGLYGCYKLLFLGLVVKKITGRFMI
jgi:hypothetical protein